MSVRGLCRYTCLLVDNDTCQKKDFHTKANDFGRNFEPISGPAIQPGFWLLFNGFSTASQRLFISSFRGADLCNAVTLKGQTIRKNT
jgi:hypothetical protein